MSPTARSLKWCREHGWIAGVVERYNTFSHKRTDLFGIIDIIAVKRGRTLGVQTTTGSNLAERVTKGRDNAECDASAWIEAGNELEFHGWRPLLIKRGGKRKRWVLRRIALFEDGMSIDLGELDEKDSEVYTAHDKTTGAREAAWPVVAGPPSGPSTATAD